MKGRSLSLVIILSCIVVFCISAYWWHSTDNNGTHQSISNLLAPLSSATNPFSSSFEVRDKVAVIIETRPLRTLIPLILHFASVLGPEWPILWLTRPSAVGTLAAFGHRSAPFNRMVKSGQVKIIELPTDQYMKNYLGISHFLASPWFWEQLGPAQHMLLFQTDSILCANSHWRADDFLEYDFIGAVHPFFAESFNGGLSIRSVPLSREVVSKWDIAEDVNNGTDFGLYEDLWFCDKMKKMGAHLPSPETASHFAVDYEWAERPLGYHGVNKGAHEDRLEEIYAWCPEAVLAATQDVLVLNEEEKQSPTFEDVEAKGGRVLTFG